MRVEDGDGLALRVAVRVREGDGACVASGCAPASAADAPGEAPPEARAITKASATAAIARTVVACRADRIGGSIMLGFDAGNS